MVINRRTLLKSAAAIGTASYLLPSFADTQSEFIIGASRLNETQFVLSAVNLTGRLQWQMPLPARGHDNALHDTKPLGVVVARRPGQYLILFNALTGENKQTIQVDPNIKLNGHAVWIGDSVVVTASDVQTSSTLLLRYQLIEGQLAFIDQTPLPYFGPHEIVRHQDHLFLAIGGLKTDARKVTNKDNFESLLLKLDARSLDIIQRYPALTQHVSLRHLSVTDNGQVFIAGQYQLAPEQSECLLFAVQGDALKAFDAPDTLWPKLKGYLGSIDVLGTEVITTSPRAHWLGKFNQHTLALTDQLFAHDICALATCSTGMVAGTGTGKLIVGAEPINSHVIWDNHFTVATR